MKTSLTIALLLCMLVSLLANKWDKDATSIQTVQINPAPGAALIFEKDILPILKAKCSPCHFEGGKMYQRMPFDTSKTILDHSAGVLKRFKEPERVLIKRYLEQSTK